MRQRRTFVIIGALGLAALGSGLFVASISPAQAVRATPVSTVITIDANVGETFAPPPSNAAPSLTPAQAYSKWRQQVGSGDTTIPSDATVQLGLLTLPVGPDCGAECSGLTVKNGIAHTALNELTYGYGTPCAPGVTAPSASPCVNWTFVDAKTGAEIDKVVYGALSGHRPS